VKDRKAKSVENPTVQNRRRFIEELLAVANFTITRSNNTDEQAEALDWKRSLEGRLRELDEQKALAA